jgi:hypothetical protein
MVSNARACPCQKKNKLVCLYLVGVNCLGYLSTPFRRKTIITTFFYVTEALDK